MCKEEKESGERRREATAPPMLAIIVPCYNEEDVIASSAEVLLTLLEDMREEGLIAMGSHLLLVDDGSSDSTPLLLRGLSAQHPDAVAVLLLSANVGHQHALMAGIETEAGICDISVSIDADLQDAPEAIREMVRKHAEGWDVVYGVRRKRTSDSWFKRNSALAFYRLMRALGVRSVFNHADFRLMSARAMLELCRYPESNLFLRGLVPIIGFRQTIVFYDRLPRRAGKSKYPLGRMINFMLDGITSFSVKPVRMIFTLGLLFTLVAIGVGVYIAVRWAQGHVVAGWSSMMLSIWFCTGMLLMALGVIGEYLGKIYTEVKRRPRYGVDEYLPCVEEDRDVASHVCGKQTNDPEKDGLPDKEEDFKA